MDDARLFLAIWPDHRLATAFRKLAENAYRDCGGRRMPVESMHLTLAFLGPTPRERIPELRAALGEVEFSPFKLVLDRFGHWEPGIVWLGGDAPPELEALAHDVREAIRAYDFSFDRKRFKPHV
ncbi:MAG: RNA 2',3'-cyclic phosphodiesterase, partial [Burkholderiales bacterium]|nr:RNA 2',3'-cyclic phosphodiesterase [Burkholderiales bacterium]